jgi:hypothetical protein
VPELPTGTVTFLFTDIEGSTRLLHELGDGYADVLAEGTRSRSVLELAATASWEGARGQVEAGLREALREREAAVRTA